MKALTVQGSKLENLDTDVIVEMTAILVIVQEALGRRSGCPEPVPALPLTSYAKLGSHLLTWS